LVAFLPNAQKGVVEIAIFVTKDNKNHDEEIDTKVAFLAPA
jgi:hypothetical protein